VHHPCDPGPVRITVNSEECDGVDLRGESCRSLGFASGQLGCSDCRFDVRRCGVCPLDVQCISTSDAGVTLVAANDARLFVVGSGGVTRLDGRLATVGRFEHARPPTRAAVEAAGLWIETDPSGESRWLDFVPNDGPMQTEAFRPGEGYRIDGLFEVRTEAGRSGSAIAFTTNYGEGRSALHVLTRPPKTLQLPGEIPDFAPGTVIETAGGWIFPATAEGIVIVRPSGARAHFPLPERCSPVRLMPTGTTIWASARGRMRTVDATLANWSEDRLPKNTSGWPRFDHYGEPAPVLALSDGVVVYLGGDRWVRFGAGEPYGFSLRYGDATRIGSESATVFQGKLAVGWSMGQVQVGLFEVP
jgi:hypothetical protein